MAYITTNQLKSRLGDTIYARLTDRIAGVTANATIAQEIVDQAEAIADSYLAVRFATPVNLVERPELATILAARVLDVAEGIAWRGSPFASDVPDRVRLVVDQAERWLRDVSAGAIALPAAAVPNAAVAVNDGPRFSASERVFSAEDLEGL